jgi:4-amino-4-deoxy-L-arabinose transferase-like glycosyltransferase
MPNYYVSHPPLVPLLISLSFKVFGTHEWAARLPIIIFSLIRLFFFYLLIDYISDRQTAFFSSIFMVFMPMFSYYGRIVDYESVTLGLSLVFLYYFVKFCATQRRILLIVLIVVAILGALSDWPFLLLFPALLFYVKSTHKGMKPYIGLTILTYLTAFAAILFYHYTTASSLNNYIQLFIGRGSHQTMLRNPEFYQALAKRFLLNFTPFSCLFLVLWLIKLPKRSSLPNKAINSYATLLIIFGITVILVVPQATFIHVWILQYLTPGFALVTALVAIKLTLRWRIAITGLFIIFSLGYLGKLHIVKNYGAYEAGKTIAKISLPKDIMLTNAISPVSFYSGIETHFFSFGSEKIEPESFIVTKLPRFVCIIKYAAEPQFDYDKIINALQRKDYRLIYDKNGVILWYLPLPS